MKLKFSEVKKGKQMSICICDNVGGSYVNIALEMIPYFKKVYYHSVNQNPFPMLSMSSIGIGFDGLERVNDFWSNLDNFDIILFPDIYFKDWGTHLRKIGKLVWGGGQSEDIETDRKLFKKELTNVNLPVAPTKYIVGIDNLFAYLKGVEDKWLKISYYRGQMETFHHINMNQSMIWLENLKVSMGPLGIHQEFIVEDGIDSIAETGYDGWCINGAMPDNAIWGVETKDSGYVGTHCLRSELPIPVQSVNDKFQSVLNKYKHTGFYSTEVRVGKDGNDYYTDPCMRAGVPPSNVYLNMITNWDDIIINGCKGTIVEPIFKAKYGAELILKSTYCYTNFMPITIPKEFRQNVKLKGAFNVDGQDYIVPFEQGGLFEMKEFGSVVVVGDDIDTIFNQCIAIADSIECYGLIYDKDALNSTKNSINSITNALKINFNK